MNRLIKGGIVIFLALAALMVGGMLAWKHFVVDRIMDGGNMENPFPESIYPLDGDHTYVANEEFFPLLEGVWQSGDGRWEMTVTGSASDPRMALSLDGQPAAGCSLHFTYLLPDSDPNRQTDLLEAYGMTAPAVEVKDSGDAGDGPAAITGLWHQAGEDSGSLKMTIERQGESETVVFSKTEPAPKTPEEG